MVVPKSDRTGILSKKSSLAVVLICVVFGWFVRLGFWQLERAEEKSAMIKNRSERENEPPISLNEDLKDLESLRYRKVSAIGAYDADHQFLLDNQVVRGRMGVNVLTPLRINGVDYAVLVNRGWVPLRTDRRMDVGIGVISSVIEIFGRVNDFPGVGYKIDGANIPAPGWPSLVQVIDSKVLSKKLGYPLLPYQVLLENSNEHGFHTDWPKSYPISPERHYAYAIQWFALALTLVVVVCWKQKK